MDIFILKSIKNELKINRLTEEICICLPTDLELRLLKSKLTASWQTFNAIFNSWCLKLVDGSIFVTEN